MRGTDSIRSLWLGVVCLALAGTTQSEELASHGGFAAGSCQRSGFSNIDTEPHQSLVQTVRDANQ